MASYNTSGRYGLRALTGGSLVEEIDDGFAALRNDLDAIIATAYTGPLGSRPPVSVGTPGKLGRFYYNTTDAGLDFDASNAWLRLNPKDQAAGTASWRTLGSGATQAAPGNDTRFPAGADIVAGDIANQAISLQKLGAAASTFGYPAADEPSGAINGGVPVSGAVSFPVNAVVLMWCSFFATASAAFDIAWQMTLDGASVGSPARMVHVATGSSANNGGTATAIALASMAGGSHTVGVAQAVTDGPVARYEGRIGGILLGA